MTYKDIAIKTGKTLAEVRGDFKIIFEALFEAGYYAKPINNIPTDFINCYIYGSDLHNRSKILSALNTEQLLSNYGVDIKTIREIINYHLPIDYWILLKNSALHYLGYECQEDFNIFVLKPLQNILERKNALENKKKLEQEIIDNKLKYILPKIKELISISEKTFYLTDIHSIANKLYSKIKSI